MIYFVQIHELAPSLLSNSNSKVMANCQFGPFVVEDPFLFEIYSTRTFLSSNSIEILEKSKS